MQTTIQGLELSVAILMDDLASAKEIASALRQSHILAHHFQSLDEFWVTANLQTPDLVIIDVTKMSHGSVQFKNHPKVVDGSMTFAFFSKDSTKILLQSTIGLKAYGYLHHDASLHAQVTSLVTRRAADIKRGNELKEMDLRIQRLQARSQRLISDRSAAEEFKSHFEFIRTFCGEIEDESNRQDFVSSLMSKLDKWESIDGFGLFELNQNGQKLVSPEVSKRKFHPFPSLWLGQSNQFGIETFAQDMATQVANDLFEVEPVSIKIHAGNQYPDMLLYISFKEERMINFPWDVFESMLSSSLRRLKLYQQMPKYTSQFMPMWEALDTMDRIQKSGLDSDSDMRVLALSLVSLTDVARRRTQNKFYWSSFFNDFFLQLSGRLQKSTKLSLMGPWHVIFFIPSENLEAEAQMLQGFIRQFGYYKFFEDNSQVLPEDMIPSLKLIPASSAHYLRLFEKEFQELIHLNDGKHVMASNASKRISF